MKIDIYNHILPAPYFEKMLEVAGDHRDLGKRVRSVPMLADLDERFRVMDMFDDYAQILSVAAPPPEVLAGPEVAPELAQRANDGMAELCQKYPERFPGFTATLAMNNVPAALEEAHRAIDDLGARGIEFYTNAKGKPLDLPEFEPIFDLMAAYDLPIWVHPARPAQFPDYQTEQKSLYEIWWTFGWPYETSAFMARMVFSGLFDRHPDLKIITHHMGGMVPFFEGRVGPGWDQLGSRTSDEDYGALLEKLERRPLDYFRLFYADTALFGSTAGTLCGLAFFGVDNVVFASDAPFDPEQGPMYIRQTIDVIERLEISPTERRQIFQGNAERLMKLA
ncbi:MAG: amidohydrolase family protein [Alphaproteobacteria bacterium]|jgi:aminocarboxymuconate-semialdehyde decarboxylase|nr:amidohydrolase [Rhodospirillaceae bacterium]MDP6407672.1 amidohydrolase family protein [Alphaproteobacteria bacterium]MDP6624366.1 amidohydrolase family protein [Alphaproteobacteria bacterium]